MTITSISQSAVSSPAIQALTKVTREIADSTQRLSTGNRFASAGDDIGALASSIKMNAQLAGLRQGQSNNLQATSMLQTAYSAAAEISDILDSMKTLAVQGNSGTLTAVERATLDLQFQEYLAEIDSIAGSTNFNGINLLDGTASGEGDVQQITDDATRGTATMAFSSAFGSGFQLLINGTTIIGNTQFLVGANGTQSATNLYNYLTTTTDANLRELNYSLNGSTITATSSAGGKQAGDITIRNVSGHASLSITGDATVTTNQYRLAGGTDDGLFRGSTDVSGTIGDSLISSLARAKDTATLTIVNNANIDDGEVMLRFDDGVNSSGVDIIARTGATAVAGEFQIGATAEETLENMVAAMEAYSDTDDFTLRRVEFEISGNSLIIRSALHEDLKRYNGTTDVNLATTAAANEAILPTSGVGALTGGGSTGVNTDNIMNADFVGTISGFSATYQANDAITASITVGEDTYNATITDTTPAAATKVTFSSSGGGSFTVDLAAGGMSVASQSDANTFATRLNSAFSGLTFSQTRIVDNFVAAGQLAGGRALYSANDFSETPIIDSISVRDSSASSNASIEIVIDGESFVNSSLGTSLGAYETYELRSTSSDKFLRITNGDTQADLSTSAAADIYKASLRTAFGTDTAGSASLSFQIGSSSADTITLSIGKSTSDALFDGETYDLQSQVNAALAETAVDAAIDTMASIIAEIGAAQSRLDYSYNANASTITEVDYARSLLADTDIPSESTKYAEYIVQQQAAISVLAQTQQLSSNLLDLLKAS